MKETSIEKQVVCVIEDALNIKFSQDADFQYSLLDPRMGLTPRDLLVVFFALQDAFQIQFLDEDILNKRFDFLKDMVEAVSEKVQALNS